MNTRLLALVVLAGCGEVEASSRVGSADDAALDATPVPLPRNDSVTGTATTPQKWTNHQLTAISKVGRAVEVAVVDAQSMPLLSAVATRATVTSAALSPLDPCTF